MALGAGGARLQRHKRWLWLLFGCGFIVAGLIARRLLTGLLAMQSPWLAVPVFFAAVQWLGDALLSVLLGWPGLLSPAEAGRKTVVFLLLGAAAVPLLGWGAMLAGQALSPLWPAVAAYVTYTFWEPVG